ncbi:hypothetical protein GCM10010912_20340 [Paenibacillus albidus]|uniref:Uncharacterized protein n=1 Tax=Paenibacillus albidus TaxID=2041023 RepID=A0A917FGZ2_9BACL|nr:hypothetical protein GCM10010912_20340 [Paenibacillus albidus]
MLFLFALAGYKEIRTRAFIGDRAQKSKVMLRGTLRGMPKNRQKKTAYIISGYSSQLLGTV